MKASVEDISLNFMKPICPYFQGFDYTILDMPEQWTSEVLRQFFSGLTALNLDVNLTDFKMTVLCLVSQMNGVMEALSLFKDFNHLFRAYYHVSDVQTVQDSVTGEPLNIAMIRREDKEFRWTTGKRVNLLSIKLGQSFTGEDSEGVLPPSSDNRSSFRSDQNNPVVKNNEGITETVKGTGVMASLQLGRNAIGINLSQRMVQMANVRIAVEVSNNKRSTQGNGNGEELVDSVSREENKSRDEMEEENKSEEEIDDSLWDDVEDEIVVEVEKIKKGVVGKA